MRNRITQLSRFLLLCAVMFLVTMIPCPLFYVPGNHDKKYEREPPEGCVNIDGRVIEYKGVRMMGLGGCNSPHPCLDE